MTTDENGYLTQLGAWDARRGFSIQYAVEEEVYLLHYKAEYYNMLSLKHLEAMYPLLIILGLSTVSIVLFVLLRKFLFKRKTDRDYQNRKTQACERTAPGSRTAFRQPISKFMTLRWAIMIVFFVFVTYGAQIFGIWFNSINIPVLACQANNEQLIWGSCFYLSNSGVLFNSSWQDIVIFAVSFFGSLLLLGRIICGFLCPMGFVQDLVYATRAALKIDKVPFTEKTYNAMLPIKWLMVILMIGIYFAGGKFCNFCPARALTPALAGVQTTLYASGFMMILVVVGSFFKRRFWCLICPLGFLMGLVSKFSLFRLKKNCTACTSCGACYEACPMGLKNVYTEREKSDITSCDCIMCGECVRRCPEKDALAITVCGKRLYSSSRKNVAAFPKDRTEKAKSQCKNTKKPE
jgi:polyferredoxin